METVKGKFKATHHQFTGFRYSHLLKLKLIQKTLSKIVDKLLLQINDFIYNLIIRFSSNFNVSHPIFLLETNRKEVNIYKVFLF